MIDHPRHRSLLLAAGAFLFLANFTAYQPAAADILPPGPHKERPVVCTAQYLPVCGRKGSVRTTYSNECSARAAGAIVVAEGECPH